MNELITKNVEVAIEEVNSIKAHMIQSGNEISAIVYGIRDELQERNASKLFAEKTGMSKASISKMLLAETLRGTIGIDEKVSYNAIYKVRDLFSISSAVTEIVVNGLESGATESEIRNLLMKDSDNTDTVAESEQEAETETDTVEEVATKSDVETEREASEIKKQILDVLAFYDVSVDDMKVIKRLLKSLR